MTPETDCQKNPGARCITIATVALFLWLLVGEIALALVTSPSSDDAMFMSVPKNWLNGYGWATSYSEKIPFNPDFTAGASLLMPSAILLALFGNQSWIPGMTGAIINLTLIALCLWQLHSYRHYLSRISMPVFLLVCILVKGEDLPSLIGYYTVSLLFFLAALAGFNPQYDISWRAAVLSILFAAGLLTKPLALPAFTLLCSLFVLWELPAATSRAQKTGSLALLFIPLLLITGGWQLFKSTGLSDYSPEYRAVWQQYGSDFFMQHGSGIEQLRKTQDLTTHFYRNTSRNLFFLEQILREYGIENPFAPPPADENHIAGILFTLMLAYISALCGNKKNLSPWYKFLTATSSCALLYTAWFLTTAMAMSPGHTSLPIQLGVTVLLLWIFTPLLQTRSEKNYKRALAILLMPALLIGLKPGLCIRVFLFDHENVASAEELVKASRYIQSHNFSNPLAGCGYGGYPRHLEYLLPGSQNFNDCYTLIEDTAELDEEYYFSHNHVDRTRYPRAIEHFHAFIGRSPLNYRFYWKKDLNFTLVISLQSADLSSKQIAPILHACLDKPLYLNNDVLITECRFDKLQQIDLNAMMAEIAINQRWYKTRLNPYEGRHFPTLATANPAK